MLQLLGKQKSVANYIRHVINLLELNNISRELLNKNAFEIKMKKIYNCLDCGDRHSEYENLSMLKITNETSDFQIHKTVRLKVIYIFDNDQYCKYEIRLSPGDYSQQEINELVREKVQQDRVQVKLNKRTFVLVDLHDNKKFG